MSFTASRQADVTLIRAAGQLTVNNRQDLKALVAQRLEKGERRFVLDFGETGYIDSSGLGALVTLARQVRDQGGDLRLGGLNEDLRTLFELTKLDTLFTIAPSASEALAGF
ncbi:MAG TPA: STAS domain-containing protein [Gemmatimonadales bacterium]|jgi:anti-sigma B factor antagonist|nr:STAS domain-containing protein [Gemmatimonadales bacterium]